MPKFEIVFQPQHCLRMKDIVEAENELKAREVFEKKMLNKMKHIDIKYITEVRSI